jgi:hypothetical protein
MILLHRSSDPSEAIITGFLTVLLFYGDGVVSSMLQPPTWRTLIILLLLLLLLLFSPVRLNGVVLN